MPLPTTNLSFSALQTEFGGSNPIALSEYYRGGLYVPSGTTSAYGTIPTSGQISFGVFRGTAKPITVSGTAGFTTLGGGKSSSVLSGYSTTYSFGTINTTNIFGNTLQDLYYRSDLDQFVPTSYSFYVQMNGTLTQTAFSRVETYNSSGVLQDTWNTNVAVFDNSGGITRWGWIDDGSFQWGSGTAYSAIFYYS